MNEFLESEFLRADQLIAQDLIEEAKSVLINILAEDPNFGKAHNHLGWIFERKENNPQKAEMHYKIAIETAPDYGAGYINYAILLSGQKRTQELRDLLQRAENIPGVNRSSLAREWAYFYEETQDFDNAIAKYKEYALTLYNNAEIEKAKAAIERCKTKKEILGL
ncbi:hypothetical protein SAMN05443429_102259 [Cruoricaptor ignavus]|uniref:Uncharacterized protein n=1 Tax=Cruoricaptor ignavus TaxID=1118202 RepID=A0A1M6C863_9FLAO|nr:hypothetical protein [Cruoricaptor ignavus]QOR73958.1 hypothetical protein IMZ16_00475 [Cruoricaptor ignavus]SHI57123.1 hypothetical protein SAMN05443429_102259 [Cruoricaptor ignavus]